jgi:aerobic carbon-monoxide dehydrogenase large subunit
VVNEAPGLSGLVGQSVTRVEDDRLLTGRGRYVADVDPPGVLHAAFLRSPLAHARIKRIDVASAKRAPGVVTVFTGADIARLTRPFPPFFMLPGLYNPSFPAMSADEVRHVGDLVALVLAESRYAAEDGLELINVAYEPLTPVASIAQALGATSELVWEKAGGNVLYDFTDTFGDVDATFAAADRVITERFSCHRQSNQPMETRGTVIEVDPDDGHLTVHAATQSGHLLRWMIAALTGRRATLSSLRRFVTDTERRRGFMTAARGFVRDNAQELRRQDPGGVRAQLSKDRASVIGVNLLGIGLLGKDDCPTVKAHDIGGAFGSKGEVAREDIALAAAAIEIGRSVKWIEDRVENLTDGGQAREEDLAVSIAVDHDGTFRGLKVDIIIDQGAFPGFPTGAPAFTRIIKTMLPGSYHWEAFEVRSRVVATNKGKYVPYRGPWANETWARERMIDVVARNLGLSPAEVRLKNMIGGSAMPTAMITGPKVDETMSTKKTLARAIELMDPQAFENERQSAAAEGRYLGLGMACYHEAAPGHYEYWDSINPGTNLLLAEPARTTVDRNGAIAVYTPQMPHGQSHETTFAQIVADELGVQRDDVRLVWGDTDRTPFTIGGTGGSRGAAIGGGAIRKASREVRRLIVEQSAQMLEAAPEDINIVAGNVHVRGVPSRALTIADIAHEATVAKRDQTEPAFDVTSTYRGHTDCGWSAATHACIVEIDLETGLVQIPRYVVVEDCGPVINPAVVDGQVRGGVAQGIGAVLYEHCAYDDEANPQATTYMDYLIPTAMEIPDIEVHHLQTLSPGENDFRSIGEGGMIGAPAAITNAIEDALAPFGARVTEQYLPPTRILQLAHVIGYDD